MRGRYAFAEVTYNGHILGETSGAEIESISYTDCAAGSSDSLDVSVDARDEKWRAAWLPETGSTLTARLVGMHWEREGEKSTVECGAFTLDEVSLSDAPTVVKLGGVSKPNDSGFSETEREAVWQNTSVKRIGETIAARYGLAFSYDATDYDIADDEQDGTDSSYYDELCERYGLVLKVYRSRLWVYDREVYKKKPSVRTVTRAEVARGSFSWSTSLFGTYTGGEFSYTDTDEDVDISCSIGGGSRIKRVNQRASSERDALIQLCAAVNNANHGVTTASFTLFGAWGLAAGSCVTLSGFGAPDGKYFIDKITHELSSGGLTAKVECSAVGEVFGADGERGEGEDGNAAAGTRIRLDAAALYVSSDATVRAGTKTGVYWLYDGILIRGRYRITNLPSRCGKLPVGQNVTGWVDREDCIFEEATE